jgi:pantetheine-phosphate adenylyltransferase
MRIGFYSGSFDPVTLGHLDVIEQACRILDRLVIGLGVNAAKTPLFSAQERVLLLKKSCSDMKAPVEIISFTGLTIDAARQHGAQFLIRGLRDGTDADEEMRLSGMNAVLAPDLQSLFIPASPDTRHISATLARQVAMMGGNASPFVPPVVAQALHLKKGTLS